VDDTRFPTLNISEGNSAMALAGRRVNAEDVQVIEEER
jgi:hypothetical protein